MSDISELLAETLVRRDAEIGRLRVEQTKWANTQTAMQVEINRLRADLESQRKAAVRFEGECEMLRTENAKLRADKDIIRSQERNAAYEGDVAQLEAENTKLRAALEEIAKPAYQCGNCCAAHARAALEETK